jgi:hypothetical protein
MTFRFELKRKYVQVYLIVLLFLDAQKAFSQAQVNYALSMLDMRLAKAEIDKIAGVGQYIDERAR